MFQSLARVRCLICVWGGLSLVSYAQPVTGTALVRHAPTLNGGVEGSIQQMTAENTTLNGGASVAGDLLVPGTPTVQLNGNPTYGGTLDGTGIATPTNHKVTLNGGAKLGHVVRRTNAVSLPVVPAPPQPTGTRSVSLNNSGQSPGDFATLKHLTLNSNVGQIVVPPGTYGNFNANAGSGFTIGVAGATTPAIYNFQNFTLNSNSTLNVLGPVVVTLNGGFSTNGPMGAAAHPEWLKLRIAGGGLSLNGNVSVYANLEAPDGTLTLNGNSRFIGMIATDRLIVNGNSLLRLVAHDSVNQPPSVTLTAPAHGASFQAPASFTLTATASDSDGTIARVEFYSGATLLGQAVSVPYSVALTAVGAGTYSYSARAIDNLGATTDSTALTITVTSPNQPPTVVLTTPPDGSLYTAPVVLNLSASATDADGSISKVEFYQGTTKLGEVFTAPFVFTTGSMVPGTYGFSAKAFDNQNAITTSSLVTVTVTPANQSPTVNLTAPSDGTSFFAPAAFTLSANAADADGLIAKVEFFQGATKIGEDAFAPFEHTLSGVAAGLYSFLARATDNAGSSADSAAITVTVVAAPNVPPSVALTAPADGAGFAAPASINLTADASDSNGTVTKVEFFAGTTKLGEDTTAPYEFAWTGVAAGNYSLTAIATDNAGASATSVARIISVTSHGVPFIANFEPSEGYQPGPLDGQNGWAVTGTATVGSALRYAGQQGVAVAPAASAALLVRAFVNIDPSVTFVDLFAMPAAASAAEAGVFFDTDAARVALTGSSPVGVLQAFQGDGAGGGFWAPTATGPVLDAAGRSADWHRLTARADYAAKKWDLYFNGRMIAADLGFVSNAQAMFSGLGLSGHATLTTGFDDLLIAFDNPLFIDADHDGMDDAWEIAHGLNPAINDRNSDLDGDGLSNIREYLLSTNPNATDTDSDGLTDSLEIGLGYDPTRADSTTTPGSDEDGDGLTLEQELLLQTDPRRPDQLGDRDIDGDGLTDLWELVHGTNPLQKEPIALLNSDADNDGLTLYQESQATTNPNNPDTDGDGMNDAYEVQHGLNPLVNDSVLDPDGDGLPNLEEAHRGTDPDDYYNGQDHEILPFIGGDFDLGAANLLSVRVVARDGTPLVNAPVTLEMGEGTAQIALTPDGPVVGRTAEIRTGPGGIARAYLKQP